MAIFTELAITVSGNKATLSSPVYLYLGDGDFTLAISITKVNAKVGTWDYVKNDVVSDFNTTWASMCILKPIPADAPEGTLPTLVYNDRCEVRNGTLLFKIDNQLINKISDVGVYRMQLHLYDALEGGNRLTIPEVSFEVLQPICDIAHDVYNPDLVAIIGSAQVDRSMIYYTTQLETFVNGNYNRDRKWVIGDIINAGEMNKIEDGIFWNTYYDNLVVDTIDKLNDISVDFITDGRQCYVREENSYYYYTKAKGWKNVDLKRDIGTSDGSSPLVPDTYNYINASNSNIIRLPIIVDGKLHEIHVFITISDANTQVINVKVEGNKTIKWETEIFDVFSEGTYEFIFTWLPQEDCWLAGYIVYGY